MEKRLIDLEVRYDYLERQLGELNEVVVTQQKTIDALQRAVESLRVRLVELGESPANERPPHY